MIGFAIQIGHQTHCLLQWQIRYQRPSRLDDRSRPGIPYPRWTGAGARRVGNLAVESSEAGVGPERA